MAERSWKGLFFTIAGLGVAVGLGILVFYYYSYIFARVIDGRVVDVKRVNSEVEGFVVSMRAGEGPDIVTARTDDPRWALVSPGQCAQAKFFPHPPWNLNDSGTYYRATLLLIRDCSPSDSPPQAKEKEEVILVPSPKESEPIPGAPEDGKIPVESP
mgnify:CR=1 FL=1